MLPQSQFFLLRLLLLLLSLYTFVYCDLNVWMELCMSLLFYHSITIPGGTFALYSLICRHAKVSLLPNQLPSDARISSFRLKVPSPELERSLKIKEKLEASLTLKKLLLMLVLAGTAMVIADGVVTPAMSGIWSSLSLLFSHSFWMLWLKYMYVVSWSVLDFFTCWLCVHSY